LEYLECYRAAVLRPNGVRLLAQAVAQIAAGRAQPRAQDASRARTYRTPDYRAVRELRRRVRARRGTAAGRWGTVAKRRLKVLLGRFFFWSGLYRVLLRRKAVIALFHRVDDKLAGNPISCTRADFEAYCRFFGRYFRVVSLETLLARLRCGEEVDRHLVITFDDGYKDNREVAARELQQHGLTACFFIATELIGSSRVPQWDAELGIASRWMSWDDVRDLRARGFEIGAHDEPRGSGRREWSRCRAGNRGLATTYTRGTGHVHALFQLSLRTRRSDHGGKPRCGTPGRIRDVSVGVRRGRTAGE
jgi:hypothetical protein